MDHGDFVESLFERHRAVLFRGFALPPEEFGELARTLAPSGLLPCPDESTPRTEVSRGVFTSTSYPAHQRIRLHNEGGYGAEAPLRIYFYCQEPPATGGETPIGDVREVERKIPATLLRAFAERGVEYVRNYRESFGMSWRRAFWTDDRAVVEQLCRDHGLAFEWLGEDWLRTTAVRTAFRVHPRTGERLWHNHASLFHPSTLEPAVRRELEREFGEGGLPVQSRFGDGAPIPDGDAAALHAAYETSERAFRWQRSDLLLLDDFTIAHGRRPFTGARRVLVALTHPIRVESTNDA